MKLKASIFFIMSIFSINLFAQMEKNKSLLFNELNFDIQNTSLPVPLMTAEKKWTQPEGEWIDLRIEKFFSDRVSIDGKNVRLEAEKAFGNPDYIKEFEITGELYGKKYERTNKIIVKTEKFGPENNVSLKKPGFSIDFRKMDGWSDMQIILKNEQNPTPEEMIVFAAILRQLPKINLDKNIRKIKKQRNTNDEKVINLRQIFNDTFEIYGDGVDLRIKREKNNGFNEEIKFEITGNAFGKEYNFGDFTLRLKKEHNNYRWIAEAPGMKLEFKIDYFAGREIFEVSGYPGKSWESAFILSIVFQYFGL